MPNEIPDELEQTKNAKYAYVNIVCWVWPIGEIQQLIRQSDWISTSALRMLKIVFDSITKGIISVKRSGSL